MDTQDFIDLLDNVVSGMSFPVSLYKIVSSAAASAAPIQNIIFTGTNYVLNVDRIYHAQIGYPVQIYCQAKNQNETYTVVGWVENFAPGISQLIVNDPLSANPLTVTAGTPIIFQMYTPKFFYGTPVERGNEDRQENKDVNKYPIIWLWMPFEPENDNDPEASHEAEVQCKIAFLCQNNSIDNLTAGLDELYLQPMKRLYEAFIDAINADMGPFDAVGTKFKPTPYPKFGIYAQNKGASKSLIMTGLTGWVLEPRLKVWAKPNVC